MEDFESDPLHIYTHINKTIIPQVSSPFRANVPTFTPPVETDPKYGGDFEEYASETHEWLSLALLGSPRLYPDDRIDTFLSRYAPPGDARPGSVIKVTWEGFISPTWSYRTFVDILLAVSKAQWFAFSITGFIEGWETGEHHSIVLKLPHSPGDYVLWDVK